MTGATGFIGSSLGQSLAAMGHTLAIVTRNKEKAREHLCFNAEVIECDLNISALAKEHFSDVDVVINLAGESIDGRWTEEKKDQIFNSRKATSSNLLQNCPTSVKTIITASAQGIYGNRGDEELTEESRLGEGFLAEVCKSWESAFVEFQNKNPIQRVVLLRIGLVLSKKGGALKKMISIFQKNIGAIIGDGNQWMSCISLEDLIRIFVQAIENDKYRGVINAVNNFPVTNAQFTKILCEKLQVLQLPKVPAFASRALLGEMSQLILNSAKLNPDKLIELGFVFTNTRFDVFIDQELAAYQDHQSVYYSEQFVPFEINKVFDFFTNYKNLEKLTPKIFDFKVQTLSSQEMTKGTLIEHKLKIKGVSVGWHSLIETFNRPYEIVDVQLKGPYAYWRHSHLFKEVPGGTLIIDEVRYKIPLGVFGFMAMGAFVDNDLSDIFEYRRKMISLHKFI